MRTRVIRGASGATKAGWPEPTFEQYLVRQVHRGQSHPVDVGRNGFVGVGGALQPVAEGEVVVDDRAGSPGTLVRVPEPDDLSSVRFPEMLSATDIERASPRRAVQDPGDRG